MGCTPAQEGCAGDEKPVRQVRIRSFEISRYETTQETWEAVMDENPSAFSGCPKCPVTEVLHRIPEHHSNRIDELLPWNCKPDNAPSDAA